MGVFVREREKQCVYVLGMLEQFCDLITMSKKEKNSLLEKQQLTMQWIMFTESAFIVGGSESPGAKENFTN